MWQEGGGCGRREVGVAGGRCECGRREVGVAGGRCECGRREVGVAGGRWVWQEGGGCGRREVGVAGGRWVWQEGGGCGKREVSAGIRYGRQRHVTSRDLHIAGELGLAHQ